MTKITVMGHTNPDTDNIASSIGMASLFRLEGKEAEALKKGNLNKETDFALNYCSLSDQVSELEEQEEKLNVFFVDFNDEAQSPVLVEKMQLVGLLDHHKLAGNWKSEEPILFRIEPVGSSSTLVAKIYNEKNIDIPNEIAKLLLCGILSDTLNFTSPTTTEEDKKLAQLLAEKTGENTDVLADKLFEAKSDLSDFSPEEIAKLDYKNFTFGESKVGIGVVETVKPQSVKQLETELKEAIRKIKEEEGLNLVYLGIVDILKNETEFLIIGEKEKEIAKKAFPENEEIGENLLLKGIVSRKKQIAPAIERAII